MDEIILIKGDSSELYQFSSKDVPVLDSTWEGKWAVSSKLGDASILEGNLTKNDVIYESDSTTVKTPANSYFIFQITPNECDSLKVGKYILAVEISKIENSVPVHRHELMQVKLNIKEQGVL